MPPDPDPSFDPEEIPYFFDNWCSLPWSPWVPFNADKHTFKEIPHEPGLYRIRPAGKDFLMYIGGTGRTLHLRLNDLRQSLRRADLMPWSDPLPEAPALWAWWSDWLSSQEEEKKPQVSLNSDWLSSQEDEKKPQVSLNSDWLSSQEDEKKSQLSSNSDWFSNQEDEKKPQVSSSVERAAAAVPPAVPADHAPEDEDQEHDEQPEAAAPVMLECSAAPLDASAAGRRGMESFLLYKYRQERGESPLCNFGRFHPRYRKSTIRKEGLRGGKLAEDLKDNPAGFPSIEPLEPIGKPGDSDWMGLEWTDREPLAAENVQAVAAGAGLYLLADAGSQEIVYIGQSADVAKRLLDHSRKTWEGRTLQFSYQIIGQSVLPHNLRELETDLIGNFFEIGQVIRPGQGEESAGLFDVSRKAPEFQFRNTAGHQT